MVDGKRRAADSESCKRIVVAITGASGVAIGVRLLENLTDREVHLILSAGGRAVIGQELGEVELPADYRYKAHQIGARLASSSFLTDAMVVAPCSMKTLSAIANGFADNLIVRVAEIMLRTNRPLVLVPRETPLSLMAIENMRKVRLAGGIILPPMVGYYAGPQTIDDVTDFFVGKILDVLGIEHQLYRRWVGDEFVEGQG
jgi:polyprenyl P-hydroxybenzoate/phenylacrylic acid decarboxylase-like protein